MFFGKSIHASSLTWFRSLCLFATLSTLPLTTISAQQDAQQSASQEIASGVIWQHTFKPAGPLNINTLQIQLDNPEISIETESAHDKLYVGEKVLDSAKRETVPGKSDVVAAVNADFWSYSPVNFTPIGLLVADGMIYNMPARNRSTFVLTKDEQPYIGPVTLNVTLKNSRHTFQIDRINSSLKSSTETVLFTPPFGSEVGPSRGSIRYMVQMNSPEFLPNQPISVQLSKIDSKTTTAISSNTMVLHIPSARAEKARSLANGTYELSAQLPQVNGVVASVSGGGPLIVSDGKAVTADEGQSTSFSVTRHPRSALGFSRDKKTVYLVTIDGRQPRVSIGVSLKELGNYMASLGCAKAINLDGGGSTTMVVNGKVVNKPCDISGPRTVASSLLIIKTSP